MDSVLARIHDGLGDMTTDIVPFEPAAPPATSPHSLASSSSAPSHFFPTRGDVVSFVPYEAPVVQAKTNMFPSFFFGNESMVSLSNSFARALAFSGGIGGSDRGNASDAETVVYRDMLEDSGDGFQEEVEQEEQGEEEEEEEEEEDGQDDEEEEEEEESESGTGDSEESASEEQEMEPPPQPTPAKKPHLAAPPSLTPCKTSPSVAPVLDASDDINHNHICFFLF